MQTVEQTATESNPQTSDREISLSSEDRHLLLSATLRLLGRRLRHGQPVFRADLLRAALLGDDVSEGSAS